MEALQKIDKWHKTLQGLVTFGVVELILAYIVFSLAIDSGNLFQYAVAILLLYGAFSNTVKAIHHVITRNGKPATSKR